MIASARPSPAGCSLHANGTDNPTPPAWPVDRRIQDVRNSWPAQPGGSAPEGPGEAQLVAVGIADVEEALAPRRITRRGLRPAAGGEEAVVKPIDIAVVEDQSAPPRPLPPDRLQDQVQEIVAGAKAGKGGIRAAMDDREPQHAVKPDGTRHVVRRQGDRADAGDHRPIPSFFTMRDPA